MSDVVKIRFGLVAKDDAARVVKGWAYVAKAPDGAQVVDHSGEFIDDPAMLEAALHGLFKAARASACDVMHDGVPVGGLVGGMTFTAPKLDAMGKHFGTTITGMPLGAWVEMEVSPEVYKRVSDGELTMFSIAGHCEREAVTE